MAAGYIFLVVLLLGALYLLLIRPENRNAEMAVYRRTMFAHRGYHNKEKLIPENSMAAFRAAVAHGYGIELDIHITRDGKVVVFHDDTLERMCGEHGKVEDYTLEELQKFHLLNTTERIPELQEVLEYVDGRAPLLVELKIPGRDLRVCEASYDILKTYHGKYLVQSFNTLGLQWYRKYAPAILRGQLSSNLTADPLNDPYILRFLVKYLMLNVIGRPDFISYKLKDLPNCSVLLCRWLWRIPVAVWTLRTEQALQQGKAKYDMYIFEKSGENY